MTKEHNINDPHSSPYDPYIGAIILYKGGIGFSDRELRPAIINHIYDNDPQDKVSIVVLAPSGVHHVDRVPYSTNPSDTSCWFWGQLKRVKRVIVDAITSGEQQSGDKCEYRDPDEGRKAAKSSISNSVEKSRQKQEKTKV